METAVWQAIVGEWKLKNNKRRLEIGDRSLELGKNINLPSLISILLLLVLVTPALAQEPVLPTATPDAEGIIYDVVQPNDSLWAIAGRHGLTFAELLALNEGLTENTVIQPGDLLIVGHGEPLATPTSPPVPTATLPPPTPRPTVVPPRTAVCLLAFNDQNRDGVYDAGEALRPGVAFTVYDETAVVANYITNGVSEPYCIEGLRGGSYHVTRSVTPQEVLTTDGDWAVSLMVGSVAQLAFGSYLRPASGETAVAPAANSPTRTANPTPQPTTTGWNPRAGFLAAAFIVMILLVGVIFLLIWRKLKMSNEQ